MDSVLDCEQVSAQPQPYPRPCAHHITAPAPPPPLLQDAHRQRTVNWCDSTGGTSAAFDFTTKGILQVRAPGRKGFRPTGSSVGCRNVQMRDSDARPAAGNGCLAARGTALDHLAGLCGSA